MQVFGGTAGAALTQSICNHLSIEPGKALVGRFNDGEVRIEIGENVRGADVFLVNPLNPPAENWIEMLHFGSALRDASAKRVTLVIPYLGYNRQERKDQSRVPFSAQNMIDVLKLTGANRVLLLDLHAPATSASFRPVIPDHLYAAPVLIPALKEMFNGSDFVVGSPDAGGVNRARKYAEMLGLGELVIFHKHRIEAGKISGEPILVGDVKNRDLLLIDDMIDSAGTLVSVAKVAKKAGAKRIVAAAAHGLFTGNAVERLKKSAIDLVFVTDSVPHREDIIAAPHINVVSIAPFFANAIRRLHDGQSLSPLFIA